MLADAPPFRNQTPSHGVDQNSGAIWRASGKGAEQVMCGVAAHIELSIPAPMRCVDQAGGITPPRDASTVLGFTMARCGTMSGNSRRETGCRLRPNPEGAARSLPAGPSPVVACGQADRHQVLMEAVRWPSSGTRGFPSASSCNRRDEVRPKASTVGTIPDRLIRDATQSRGRTDASRKPPRRLGLLAWRQRAVSTSRITACAGSDASPPWPAFQTWTDHLVT